MPSKTIEQLKWRYATKKFDPTKKLSDEKLNILKQTFNLTATSFGLQPLKMIVVSNQELKEKLLPFTFYQSQIRDASHILVLCIEKEIDANFIVEHFKRVEETRKTSREILDPYEQNLVESFEKKHSEEIRQWMVNQLYLVLGALLTVCAVEEIDSCPMEGFEPENYDKLLNLGEMGLESVIVLPVGYREKSDFFIDLKKVRRGVDELVIDL